MQKQKKSCGLYLHLPFCEKKCFYCSFVVTIARKKQARYVASLAQEIEHAPRQNIATIYWGGGTPSLLTEAQSRFLAQKIQNHFSVLPQSEFTVEGNPEHITPSKIQLWKEIGVNRFSLGAQSFQPRFLKFLGRNHNRKSIFQAYTLLREEGFKNINLDLIYGIPGQSLADIKKDLETIRDLDCEHVSLYALTIERNSLFHARKLALPDDHAQGKQYQFVKDYLEDCGFIHYEVSNFAKPHMQSQHNCHYWRGGNYLGCGVGAHSHMNGRRFWNVASMYQYIDRVNSGQSPLEGEERLTSYEQLVETFLFGLRMQEGVNVKELQKRFCCTLEDSTLEMIRVLIQEGLLTQEKQRLRTTRKGMLVLDEICAKLI